MTKIKAAFVFKYLPAYRIGVFSELAKQDMEFDITFYSGKKGQEGIKLINWQKFSQKIKLCYAKTYFYKPSQLLWQKGIIKQILFSKNRVFVFDGAISHIPVWAFLILCKITRKKALLWSHGFKGVDKGLKLKVRILFFKHLATGNLLYGHTQRNMMIDLGFSPKALTVVYNSLQPKIQREILTSIDKRVVQGHKQKLFEASENFTLLFIGRLTTRKKVLDVVKAVSDLKNIGIAVNCILIGSGEIEEQIRDFVKSKKIEKQVHFTGPLYDENDIAQYFAMADMMLSPGNVGLNCIHSLGYGVPVCTHDNFVYQNPEVEAIKNTKTGIMFKYNNYGDMIQKITEYIDSGKNKTEAMNDCFEIIDSLYNPQNQSKQIKLALANILN